MSSIRSSCWAASISAAADVAAQRMVRGKKVDLGRTARIAAFSVLTFGPQQSYLNALGRAYPRKTMGSALAKTLANQFVFAPVNISLAFLWELGLTGKMHRTKDKFRTDLGPMLIGGSAFWIPLTLVGFATVPVGMQAAFFKVAGVPWKIYTAHAVTSKR